MKHYYNLLLNLVGLGTPPLVSTHSIMDEFTSKFKEQAEVQLAEQNKQARIIMLAKKKESNAIDNVKLANKAIAHFESILGE